MRKASIKRFQGRGHNDHTTPGPNPKRNDQRSHQTLRSLTPWPTAKSVDASPRRAPRWLLPNDGREDSDVHASKSRRWNLKGRTAVRRSQGIPISQRLVADNEKLQFAQRRLVNIRRCSPVEKDDV